MQTYQLDNKKVVDEKAKIEREKDNEVNNCHVAQVNVADREDIIK